MATYPFESTINLLLVLETDHFLMPYFRSSRAHGLVSPAAQSLEGPLGQFRSGTVDQV